LETWVMLRGYVPEDRPAESIFYPDMWTELWRNVCGLAGAKPKILYLDRRKAFHDGMVYQNDIYACHTLIDHMLDTSLIFHRGGFPEFDTLVKLSRAPTMYYGAGLRKNPTRYELYKFILRDSFFTKPCIDTHFKILPEVEKEFDVCYIANAAQRKIKGIDWVYDTAPDNLKILHLCRDAGSLPLSRKNIVRIEAAYPDMPRHINRCRIGIVPYWGGYDQSPRVIPEMNACGLPLAVADEVECSCMFCGVKPDKGTFWDGVKRLPELYTKDETRDFYDIFMSLDIAAKDIHAVIKERVLCQTR